MGVAAQTGGAQFFPDTGHWLSGAFLDAYLAADNPKLVYGSPITDAFESEDTQLTVQYFERARFELHLDALNKQQVIKTPLGKSLYKPGKEVLIPENNRGCQVFPESHGYQVCYTFLRYFNRHGKAAQFGYPISNLEIQDDRFVQYFELARFEWRTENLPWERVVLSDLGRLYFDEIGENPERLYPTTQGKIIQTVKELKTRAYLEKAVTRKVSDQSIMVMVEDQNDVPVNNALVRIEIHLPSGEVIRNSGTLLTDKYGTARFSFSYQETQSGQALVKIQANFGKIMDSTATTFRLWW